MADLILPGACVAIACVLSFIINIFTLVVFFKRKRLRIRAHLIPLFHLAVVDLLAMITWSALSVVIAVADWSPSPEVCQVHAFFRSLWNMIHMHSLAVLAIERAIRLVKPSRHVVIFVPRVVLFLLAGVWTFDILVSAIPHFGWLDFALVTDEMQCSPDFTTSIATLDFDFCVRMALPVFLFMLPAFILSFCKVWYSRRKKSCTGEILLETSPYCTGPAYAERVTRYHETFKEVGVNKVKPTLGKKTFTHQGYVTDSDSDVNTLRAKDLRIPRKVYSLPRREYVLLKTYVIITCVYVILWFPYVVVTLLVNYEPRKSVAGWLVTAVTCLTHCSQFVLPLVYLLFNDTFRRCAVKTLLCGRKRKK